MEHTGAITQQMDREQHAARAPTDDQDIGRHARIECEGSDECGYAAS
jgi:hypothetical protein